MKLNRLIKKGLLITVACCLAVPGFADEQEDDSKFIVVIGAPASGKSVNSELLQKAYDIPWINVREELMKEIKKESKRNRSTASTQHKRGAASSKRKNAMKEAVAKLEAGELVSGDTLNALIASEFLSSIAKDGFILDGYPMTVEQAEFLDSLLELRDMSPLKVIYLDIPDEVALQRMKERGREDDKRDIGRERLRVFNSMIGPLKEYYADSALVEIDATKGKAAISSEIIGALEN